MGPWLHGLHGRMHFFIDREEQVCCCCVAVARVLHSGLFLISALQTVRTREMVAVANVGQRHDRSRSVPLRRMAHIDVAAHRVLHPLNWSHALRQPVDGDVKKTTVAGEKVYVVRGQPRGQRPISGVSLFISAAGFGAATHGNLGSETAGCAVTVPGTLLPAGLGIVHDGPLKLRLHGMDQPPVECGQHYTLYAAVDMVAAEFEVLFQQFMSTCLPCTMQGQADPAFVVDDEDDWPGDPLVSACVMALDDLAATTTNPNTKLFAKLFALHLQAVDPGFEEVLRIGPLADMAAAALSSFYVCDPFLLSHVCDARDRLADTLGYALPPPTYEPHWVSR